MKRLFLLFLLTTLTHLKVYSQDERQYLTDIVEKFESKNGHIDSNGFIVNNKKITLDASFHITDSLLKVFISEKIDRSYLPVDFDMLNSNKEYISFILQVGRINGRDILRMNKDTIINLINKLANDKDRQFALFFLQYHFHPYLKDSVVYNYLNDIYKSAKKTNDYFEYKIYDDLLRSLYGSKKSMNGALAGFIRAYNYYDSLNDTRQLAFLDVNIADLFFLRNRYNYLVNGMKNLDNAIFKYIELKDTFHFIYVSKKYAYELSKILDSAYDMHEDEFVEEGYDFNGSLKPDDYAKLKILRSKCKIIQLIYTSAIDKNNHHGDHLRWLAMGNYFFNVRKMDVAFFYYKLAINNIGSQKSAFEVLSCLAVHYNIIKHYNESLFYINSLEEYTENHNNVLMKIKTKLLKGYILNSSGKFEQAVAEYKMSLILSDSADIEFVDKTNVQCDAFEGLSAAYRSLKMNDSAATYSLNYNNSVQNIINEEEKLNSLENRLDLQIKNRVLSRKEKAISFANTFIFWLIIIIVVGFALFWITVVIKNRTVKKVRAELNGIAIGKHHNLKGNFTTTNLLLFNKKYDTALNYTQASSDYYNSLIDMEDMSNNKWTLQQEKNILEAFCDKEKIYRDNFNFKFESGKLEIEKILFIPEVLTTMLDNSIRHGFNPKKKGYYFRVDISKKGKYLYFEVSDNGKFAGIENYFRKETPNKGLNFTKRRIKNELSSKIRFKKCDDFIITENKDKGTTIKFKYPYALSA